MCQRHLTRWIDYPGGYAYRLTDAPTRVFPSQRGILLDPVGFDVPDGFDVVFPADGLRVDLGQFRLLDSPALTVEKLVELMDHASHNESALNESLHESDDGSGPFLHMAGGLVVLLVNVPLGALITGLAGIRLVGCLRRFHRRPLRRAELQLRLRQDWGLPAPGP